jgi:hypothetical protein
LCGVWWMLLFIQPAEVKIRFKNENGIDSAIYFIPKYTQTHVVDKDTVYVLYNQNKVEVGRLKGDKLYFND